MNKNFTNLLMLFIACKTLVKIVKVLKSEPQYVYFVDFEIEDLNDAPGTVKKEDNKEETKES